ncbi:hypothetical protein DSO57_1007688 [Entomophthora muscae]|uniref:Uncharacterized protein n=1 Tax=Entomophthora muscae TaxID=34485 RepID=A0ACC2U5K0_9FUNG|nr:hypothetical protein DSO57_1007688 [Entomophthora muscae]
MKLIVAASLPLLGALIAPPFGALIPLVWLALPFGPSFLASACRGSTSGKRGQAVPQSPGPAACGNSGSGFESRPWARVSQIASTRKV